MKKKIMAMFLAVALAVPFITGVECSLPVYAAKNRINVTVHTPDEIRNYLNNDDDLWMISPVTYDASPSISSPYSAGKLSEETEKQALATLNGVRYIAGIDYHVTLDSDYVNYAQHGALVNAIDDCLCHYPSKPAGMTDEMFSIGYKGTSSSNLGYGYLYLTQAIVYGWMSDDDQSNISKVGHRRWFLNPTLGKTGFGCVANANGRNYMSAYVVDTSKEGGETGVSWPAQNMPTEFFDAEMPWSISFGTTLSQSSVSVTLTNKATNKTWLFSNTSSDGDFYVDNDCYGQKGCVIFRPKGISEYRDGDVYQVSINGLGTSDGYSDTASYTVTFFDWDQSANSSGTTSQTNQNDSEDTQPTTPVKSGAATMYRLYNPNSGEHFYTSELAEKDNLVSVGWSAEGDAWNSPEYSSTPVYRVYNPNSGEHHYTTSAGERDNLVALGWNDEGIGWYSAPESGTPLYRLYNPNATGSQEAGAHHYTKDAGERDYLISIGWNYEGIGWYGL